MTVKKYALDVAKEITIAKLKSSDVPATSDAGECAADFFEAVYTKVLELAVSAET